MEEEIIEDFQGYISELERSAFDMTKGVRASHSCNRKQDED
jgi:hypothetical protein